MQALMNGRSAIVTGAASGIGRAIAIRLGAEGARVIGFDLRREPREGGDSTDEVITAAGGRAQMLTGDVRRPDDFARAVAAATQTGDSVDVLVNSAGLFFGNDFTQTTIEDYDRMMDIGTKGAFFCTQAAVSKMKPGGSVIMIASVAAQKGLAGFGLYCLSKGAMRLMTLSLADELGPRGIRVNAICPGFIDSTMTRQDVPILSDEGYEATVATVPLGRPGVSADLGGTAVFLASDLSSYVTGALLNVDGGILRN